MNYWGNKILLIILRLLIYLKRGIFFIGKILLSIITFIGSVYRKTIGFYIYKFSTILKKKIFKNNSSWGEIFIDLLGRRGTLQLILLIIIFIIILPQTKIMAKTGSLGTAERSTLLYKLIDIGEAGYNLEEIYSEPLAINNSSYSWSEGALSQQQIQIDDTTTNEQQNTSISAGGSALIKPTIISPNNTGSQNTNLALNRDEVIDYTVEPGDTISAISKRFNVSIATILWSNGLTARSFIRPGDNLKILPTTGVMHKVAKGDTVKKIAKLYNVDEQEIIKFNKLDEDSAILTIGSDLIVPNGVKPEPKVNYVPQVKKYTQLNNVVAPPPSAEVPAGSGYIWPTAAKTITQYYKLRHPGLDIGGPIGTAIYATKAGKVYRSECRNDWGYGCAVILDHGGGVKTVYAHASKLLVAPGDEVFQGQTIALMGSTGRSTGSHLHFEVNIKSARLNPLQYVRR